MSDRVQKMARINVDPAAWGALRVQALRSNRFLADLLGELIEESVGSAGSGPQAKSARLPAARPPTAPPTPVPYPDQQFRGFDTWVPPWKE